MPRLRKPMPRTVCRADKTRPGARHVGFLVVLCLVLTVGASLIGATPARAAGTVTITSPTNGSAAFGNPTFTARVSDLSNAICVAFKQADGSQIAYSCKADSSGNFTATSSFIATGVQTITATVSGYSGADVTSAPIIVIVDPGAYHALNPQRVLDTRTNYSGGVDGQGTTTFSGYSAGVPTSATAFVFNLTETGATAPGFVTAYGGSANRPTASNLNFNAGQTVANLVTVGTSYGSVTLYNGSANGVQLIADLVGYYDNGQTKATTEAGHFVGLTPSRVLDTRQAVGVPGTTPVGPQGTVAVQVAGRGGVPSSGATGVVFTLTETQAAQTGNLRAYPPSGGSTETSSVNFVGGQDAANLVSLPLDNSGSIGLLNSSPGTTHMIVDVVGYYTGAPSTPTAAGLLTPIAPIRLLDTRYGTGAPQAQVPAGGSVTLGVGGALGVPASAASSAALNVTVTNATALGYLTVYPAGQDRPTASTLNFVPYVTAAALTLGQLGQAGAVTIYNNSQQPVDVIVDATGFFTS